MCKSFPKVTMELLKLPSLVQQKIFGFIELHNLLVLSFCSKRTRYLIQSLQGHQWKDMKFVTYSFEEKDTICVSVTSETMNGLFSLSPITPEQPVITPMDVFGMGPEIPICLHPRYFGNEYIYDKEQKQLVVQRIHDYLYQFLGSSSIDSKVESTEHKLPPSLKNINSTSIKVPENTTAEELEACFTASPNQDYIEIDGHFYGSLCPKSAILGAYNLSICFKGGHGDEILSRFKGTRLQLHSAKFHDSTISQFLNEWKSNRGFQKLMSLSISSYHWKNYDAVKILKDMDVKQLEEILRIISPTGSFRSRDYLIRDVDGEKASVLIENYNVRFALWKGNSCEMEIVNR
ncbi:hypothetical protein GCK72_016596 [Caenorhabditis remanei]|uniref:F-box domain-containing protein n=1 Tax=Caenorhabditis remanei TaxID=31234 RepID=A0A6A5G5M9_CAERE|nr:hypothetical protein GCK72_016596 [Caenorhabditis remanei]KAF1750051.1 hypothetical protein GCK72_016596 [Caenorhabditis remanei]